MNEKEEPPGTFLSVPDPMSEFKKHFTLFGILNPNNPFTHLSKFIFIDQMSAIDNGNMFKNGYGRGALDEIGRLSPHNWYW